MVITCIEISVDVLIFKLETKIVIIKLKFFIDG